MGIFEAILSLKKYLKGFITGDFNGTDTSP